MKRGKKKYPDLKYNTRDMRQALLQEIADKQRVET